MGMHEQQIMDLTNEDLNEFFDQQLDAVTQSHLLGRSILEKTSLQDAVRNSLLDGVRAKQAKQERPKFRLVK